MTFSKMASVRSAFLFLFLLSASECEGDGTFLQKYFLFPHVLSGVFSYHDTPFGHNPQLNTGKTGAFLTFLDVVSGFTGLYTRGLSAIHTCSGHSTEQLGVIPLPGAEQYRCPAQSNTAARRRAIPLPGAEQYRRPTKGCTFDYSGKAQPAGSESHTRLRAS